MDQKKKKRKKIGPKVCLLSLQYLTSETTPPPQTKTKTNKKHHSKQNTGTISCYDTVSGLRAVND